MNFFRQSESHSPRRNCDGFALVATILLMVLLAIITVGTLSLSVVTVRTNNQDSAQALARANAKMALMIAIGELQKEMGPDRAISATSEILATTSSPAAKPNTTGAWESWWDFDQTAAPDYNGEKVTRFRRWLVSNADDSATRSMDFAMNAWSGNTIELVGDGTLGTTATAADKVTAGLVPISKDGKIQGHYAWHVADESVKARINLYRDPSQNTTLAQKRALLAGHRPDPSVLESTDGTAITFFPKDLTADQYANALVSTGKVLDLDQAELLDQARGKIKLLRHHITTHSLGVMADVRSGGLKQDLSSMFEMGSAAANTLPAEFTNKKLYESTLGITGISDPYWSALAGYYNSFRNLTNTETNPTYALKAGSISNNPVPDAFSPAPVITKVDTIFSLIARPFNNQAGWISGNVNLRGYFDYGVGLITSPVVTLHNPYNVNISFYKLEVSFNNLPVAFNMMLSDNGSAYASQSTVPNQFEAMNTYAYNASAYGRPIRNDRNFVMTIADWSDDNPLLTPTGAPGSSGVRGPIVMKPGQTLICGIALRANSSYDLDTRSASNVAAMDWENTLYNKMKGKPVYTPGIGFETLAVAPGHLRGPSAPNRTTNMLPTLTTGNSNLYPGAWAGQIFMLLRDANAPAAWSPSSVNITDRFYIEYKIQRPEWFTDDSRTAATATASYIATGNMRCPPATFGVSARLQATATDSLTSYANLQFNYGDQSYQTYSVAQRAAYSGSAANVKTANDNLDKIFGNRIYRYPPTGYLVGSDFAAPPGVLYSQQAAYVHPFAIFSAYARSSSGGVYETGSRTAQPNTGNSSQINLLKDGRLAGKPFLYHNSSRSNFTMDLTSEKPAVQAFELNFQPFLSKGDYQDYMDVDAANRVPSLTGNKTTSGIKSGSYLELPSGPLQTIADFRRSNALTTSYPPHFVQPVGNSHLHPLMSPDKVIETDAAITPNAMLDHSFLANNALYDRFYFSTFATRGTTTPDSVFEQFMQGIAPLSTQAFQPYLSNGKTITTAKAELYSAGVPKNDAYKLAAEYQMIRNPFNVNSTSVQAWKAVLASMNQSDVATLWARNTSLETIPSTGIPITAMSMPNGGSLSNAALDSSKIDNVRTNTWNGFRELTEAELETLAEKIVDEVRARGPFLSMSEFVNRRVGPADEKTLSGALEAAIAKAEINEELNAVYPDTFLNQVPINSADLTDTKLYNYKTTSKNSGNPAAGAPGWVSQGDLLRILEPSATVRGDTFVIRTYGEALDSNGKVIAQAYAEAVVQRFPDYVDSSDRPSTNTHTDPAAKPANKTYGRRFEVVAFRWLSKNEI